MIILSTRLLRAAGGDRYERGDCWTQLAPHQGLADQLDGELASSYGGCPQTDRQ